jgi:hypothetical protein
MRKMIRRVAMYILTPKEADELQHLEGQLPVAAKRAAEAMRTKPPRHMWTAENSERFFAAEAEIDAVRRRITELTLP